MAHGSEADLRAVLEPLFIKYKMDVVFAGHEHFYERVKPQKGIYYFTCRGSAMLRKGDIRKRSELTEKGDDVENTFMVVEVTGGRVQLSDCFGWRRHHRLAPGTWHLAPGTWHLAPGTRHLTPSRASRLD